MELTAHESETVMKLSLSALMVTVKGNFLGEVNLKEVAKIHKAIAKALVMIDIYVKDLQIFDGADTRRRLSNWRFRCASLEHQLKNITLKGVI